MKVYIGIDNGVSGSIAYIGRRTYFVPTPTRKEQSYTKAKAQITRIDWKELEILFAKYSMQSKGHDLRLFIERPFTNPKGLKAMVSAMRALESTLIAVERYGLSYEYIDSRQWQKVMLPKGCKGAELKVASMNIGIRLFPLYAETIKKHKDADSLLIAEWARREQL